MADMITRCPKCDTAFRITPAHLRSARGSVRCGSCLQVFNAKQHLISGSSTTDTTKNPEQHNQPAPQPTVTSEPDDLLISDDMGLDLADTDPRGFETSDLFSVDDEQPQKASLFEREPADTEDDEDEVTEDESWALKLLDDDEEDTEPRQPTSSSPVDEAPIDHPTRTPDEPVADAPAEDEEGETDEDGANDWLEDVRFTPITEEYDDTDLHPAPLTPPRRDSTGSPYLDAIEPEPVEFSVKSERSFWHSRLLWALLSLVALIALLGQIAWLQYPVLNRVEPYRDFYGLACEWLGCELPAQRDLDAIRTSNLVVRSHPRQDNALMVDVILQNTAPFAQPFPSLELTFSDLQSRTVAQRQFRPAEYLGGELAGSNEMPVRQPVHIAIEIADPGPEAVNYRIEPVAAD